MNLRQLSIYSLIKKPLFLLCLFILGLFYFSSVRSFNELHWGSWATGDAQNLISAKHFAEEGFAKHYFLTCFRPGYLAPYQDDEPLLWYYTHYPPLSAIFLGFLMRTVSGNIFFLRHVAIVFALASLILWYFCIKRLFNNETIALLASVFIGSSVAFLSQVDGLSCYTFDEFLAYGAILFFLNYASDEILPAKKQFFSAFFCTVFVFLSAFNSVDYIIFLQVFFIGYRIISGKRHLSNLLPFLWLSAFLSLALHIFQNSFVQGGIIAVLKDLAAMLTLRSSSKGSLFSGELWFNLHFFRYNFSYTAVEISVFTALFIILLNRYRQEMKKEIKLSVLFLLCSSVWALLAFRQFMFFSLTMFRIYFAFLSICFSLAVFHGFSRLIKDRKSIFSALWIFLLCVSIYPPLRNLAKYMDKYPHIISPAYFWGISWESREEIDELIMLSKKIRKNTIYGDVILVPDEFLWSLASPGVSPILEYYAERRLKYAGKTFGEFSMKLAQLARYKSSEYVKSGVNIYVLIRPGNKEFIMELKSNNFLSDDKLKMLFSGHTLILKIF